MHSFLTDSNSLKIEICVDHKRTVGYQRGAEFLPAIEGRLKALFLVLSFFR